MSSLTASRINSNARSLALTWLTREHRLAFLVYAFAHGQAGAKHPRNEAKADLAALHPEQYRRFYDHAKAASMGVMRP